MSVENMEVEERKPDLLDRLMDTTAKVYFLLDRYHLWSEDETFTFPDGDTWSKEEQEKFRFQGL